MGRVPAWLLWQEGGPDGACRAEMTAARPAVVWGLIAEHAAAAGRRVMVDDVCAVAVSSAQVSGAWVVAASSRGPDFVMCVTDRISEQLAELQQMLGEGPCHDVLAAAAPVLAADLQDQESSRRWPAFAPEARRIGASAVFAFPLVIGAIQAGVIGLYRSSPGPLSSLQLGDCLLLADT
ncbi:MAG: GAF domain-containing protein, partial [Streptosporangiaceae bacterium]